MLRSGSPSGAHLPIVLIVDDHAAVRTAVRERFETSFLASVVCGEAENGADAIVKAQKLKPDLIVLDLSMPVMGGFEAARALRQLFPAIQIVMLTAHYLEVTKQAALLAGITEVFSKHQDLSPLISHARSVFGM
jgi:two-component system, NarL family, invasion response regulator UvrY